MILNYINQLLFVIKKLLICFLLYFICRLLFYTVNIRFFPATSSLNFIHDSFYGLRFDTFSIFVGNSLFIFLAIIPSNLFNKKYYQVILKSIFIFSNAVFILTNFIDIGYFSYTKKRSSFDLVDQIFVQTDFTKLLPEYISNSWWLAITYILAVTLLIYFYKKIKQLPLRKYVYNNIKEVLGVFFIFIGFSLGIILGIRGGFQRVPIDIINVANFIHFDEIPIVLNTPFTIIKSVSQKEVTEYNFYSSEFIKANSHQINYFKNANFKKINVVVIILESFSKEYTKLGSKLNMTPFLDSLMDHSLVFSNSFSNGSKSIEGIPAILSSMPSLMENPFINSVYATNKQTTFAEILNKEGYTSAFFHGGINGTMNFDDWSDLAGYKYYYGKNEYNNNDDFDGFWGIYDEEFLQFSLKKINELKVPFHAAIFTLSSHHPYTMPSKYRTKFQQGPNENSETIRYADYALRYFFHNAKTKPWFKNTLFILSADHSSISKNQFYSNIIGAQSIPILFYKGDNSLVEINNRVFSQIDILPTALNLIGYNKKFFSHGKSFNDTLNRKSYYYANNTYYAINDSMIYSFLMPELKSVFNYKRDSCLKEQLINKYPLIDAKITQDFKVFIQNYNQSLIKNTARVK